MKGRKAMRNLPKCNGISKRSKKPCQAIAMKNGKCYMHGGKSTGPKDREAHSQSQKGNTNNKPTTGEFEHIGFDTMTDEEKFLLESMNVQVKVLIDHEIQLMTLREYRMMKRIQALMDVEDGMTLVRVEEERGTSAHIRKRTNLRKETREGVLGQIQAIEDALTRLQGKKARIIEMKYNIEQGTGSPQDTSGIEKFLKALNGAAKNVWGDEKEPAWLKDDEA